MSAPLTGVPQLIVDVHRLFGLQDVRGDASFFQSIQVSLRTRSRP